MDYDLNRTDLPPPCACGQRCTMTLGVWRQLLQFAQASGHRLLFGLAPKTDMALDLIRTAQNDSVFAYTFGNEINSAALFDGYKQIRALLDDGSVFPDKEGRPLLAGPDVALQRHASLEDALAGRDATIMSALAWVETFAQEVGYCSRRQQGVGMCWCFFPSFFLALCLRIILLILHPVGHFQVGDTLDALSFHTYDFETAMLGMLCGGFSFFHGLRLCFVCRSPSRRLLLPPLAPLPACTRLPLLLLLLPPVAHFSLTVTFQGHTTTLDTTLSKSMPAVSTTPGISILPSVFWATLPIVQSDTACHRCAYSEGALQAYQSVSRSTTIVNRSG